MAEKCFLCEKNLSDGGAVKFSKKKGIIHLIKSSLKREDGKHLQLKNLNVVPVHVYCSIIYNCKSNIRLSLKKMKLDQRIEKHSLQTEQQNQQLIINGGQAIVKPEIVDNDVKRHVVETAASIIRKDIELMMYRHLSKPNLDKNFLQDPQNIPESLDLFLTKILKKKSNTSPRSFEHISVAQNLFANYLLNIKNI